MKDFIDKAAINIYRLVFGKEPSLMVDVFIKNLNFIFIGFGVSAVLGLITQIFAGRILGPSEYGKYSLIQAIASFLSLPMLAGVATALIKYNAEKDNFSDRKKIISTSFLLFLFFSGISLIILLIFSEKISNVLGISLELFIYAVIFSFLSSSYLISISVAQSLKEMKTLSILQVIYGVSGIAAFFLLLFLKVFSFKAILFASLANYFIVFILTVIIFHKYFSLNFDKNLAKKILRYGFYASVISMAYVVYTNFDRIVINRFSSTAQVGVYGAYYIAFITSAGFIFNAFNIVFFPMVSGAKDKEAIFAKINKIMLKFSLFFLLCILLLGIAVLKLYGSKYQFNFWLCLLFDLVGILSVINGIYAWCMNGIGEKGVRLTSFASVAAAAVNIMANLLLVPVLGFFGAIIAIMLSYIVSIVIIISKKGYYKSDKLTVNQQL